MTRVVARWVPKILLEEQKREKVKVSRDLLKAWRIEKYFLNCIVTGMKRGSIAMNQRVTIIVTSGK